MNKNEQERYAEMMEMKTNKLAKEIINMVKNHGLDPQAAIVGILKASAILIESFGSMGGDANQLESMIKEMIGPAREEARELLFKNAKDIFNN